MQWVLACMKLPRRCFTRVLIVQYDFNNAYIYLCISAKQFGPIYAFLTNIRGEIAQGRQAQAVNRRQNRNQVDAPLLPAIDLIV